MSMALASSALLMINFARKNKLENGRHPNLFMSASFEFTYPRWINICIQFSRHILPLLQKSVKGYRVFIDSFRIWLFF